MAWFRAKTCVIFLFSLITFGQAYPFSYAWAMEGVSQCSCNLSGRKCAHGCDLKKRPKATGHEGHDHAAMGHTEGAGGHEHGKASASLASTEDEAKPHWVSPDCSKQKRRDVLSFRGDPFVPQATSFFLHSEEVELRLETELQPPKISFLPEPPPPKAHFELG